MKVHSVRDQPKMVHIAGKTIIRSPHKQNWVYSIFNLSVVFPQPNLTSTRWSTRPPCTVESGYSDTLWNLNFSRTVAGITKWSWVTIERYLGYLEPKFEGLVPTSLGFGTIKTRRKCVTVTADYCSHTRLFLASSIGYTSGFFPAAEKRRLGVPFHRWQFSPRPPASSLSSTGRLWWSSTWVGLTTELTKKVFSRLRDSACWYNGEITQPT